MSSKAALLARIRELLEHRLERLNEAASESIAAATDPDSKAENKYDTRSLEASYLASGQARQVEETAEALRLFTSLTLPNLDLEDPVEPGALVEVDIDEEPAWFLLVPAGGGLTVDDQGREVTLLTPSSPLYAELIGSRVGDRLASGGLVTEVE